MDLDELTKQSHTNAQNKGFYEEYESALRVLTYHGTAANMRFFNQIWLSHRLMLIVSELAEGLEAIRDNNFSCAATSHGLGEELTDAQIRIADLYKSLFTLPMSTAVQDKMEYNASRPYKHNRSL